MRKKIIISIAKDSTKNEPKYQTSLKGDIKAFEAVDACGDVFVGIMTIAGLSKSQIRSAFESKLNRIQSMEYGGK